MEEKEFDFFKQEFTSKTYKKKLNLFFRVMFVTMFAIISLPFIFSFFPKENKNLLSPPIDYRTSLDNRTLLIPVNLPSEESISPEEIKSLIPLSYEHFLFDKNFKPVDSLNTNANKKDIFIDMFLKGDPSSQLIVEKITYNKDTISYFVRTHILYQYSLDIKLDNSIKNHTYMISDSGDFIYHIIKQSNKKAIIKSFGAANTFK